MQTFAFLNCLVVEVRIIRIVLLSCLLQAINTLDSLPCEVHRWIGAINMVCVYVFVVEFFLRWWSAGRFQLRYLSKPLVLIDAVRAGVHIILTPLIYSLVFLRFFPKSAARNLSFRLLCHSTAAAPPPPPPPWPPPPPPSLHAYTTPSIAGSWLQIVFILPLILNFLLPLWDHL
jgi:hypothetical protein